jgi:hypothetical protein
MSRGRRPEWAAAVQRLEGSAEAKAQLAAVLEVWAGRCTAASACLGLGLAERRFRALGYQALRGALAALEPRPAGRPARLAGDPDARVAALEAAVRQLQLDLQAAQVREEIALVLPQVLDSGGRAKGARRRKARRRGRESGAPAGCGRWCKHGPSRRARAGAAGRPGSGTRGSGSAGCGPGRWRSAAGQPAAA